MSEDRKQKLLELKAEAFDISDQINTLSVMYKRLLASIRSIQSSPEPVVAEAEIVSLAQG